MKTLVENTHLEYPQIMIELSKRLNVPVIDLCSKSKEFIEEAGTEVSKEWFNHVSVDIYKELFLDPDEDGEEPALLLD